MENDTASHMYQSLNCIGFSSPGRKTTQSGSFPSSTLMLPSVTEITQKMPRDGTSHCQVLVQNSCIRTATNTRSVPSDFSKSNRNHVHLGRPRGHSSCQVVVCHSYFPRGVFPALPIAGLSAQALHLRARSYLNTVAVFVNDCCHSYQDGISSVHSL